MVWLTELVSLNNVALITLFHREHNLCQFTAGSCGLGHVEPNQATPTAIQTMILRLVGRLDGLQQIGRCIEDETQLPASNFSTVIFARRSVSDSASMNNYVSFTNSSSETGFLIGFVPVQVDKIFSICFARYSAFKNNKMPS